MFPVGNVFVIAASISLICIDASLSFLWRNIKSVFADPIIFFMSLQEAFNSWSFEKIVERVSCSFSKKEVYFCFIASFDAFTK